MFKRVEKRRRKKEEEDELGLDEDTKEVLGMQDTDSDESNSDSDSDSDSGGSDVGEDINGNGDEEVENDAEGGDEEDDSEAENPEITVQDALDDPVYLISLDPDVKACIVCPGKLLKHAKMIEVHRTSGAHRRRFTRFAELARGADPEANAWDILKLDSAEKATEEKSSKRSQKRKAKLAAVKTKRERQKEMKAKQKAKQKAKADGTVDSPAKPTVEEEPAKKKQKLEKGEKSKRTQYQRPPRPPKGDRPKDKVADEVAPTAGAEKRRNAPAGAKRIKDKTKPLSKGSDRPKRRSSTGVLKVID